MNFQTQVKGGEPAETPGNARHDDRAATRLVQLAFIGSVIYATARYHFFQDAPWSDWPAYTLNKALALAALALLVISVARRRLDGELSIAHTMSMAGIFFALHGVISLALLSPVYYPKLFLQDKLTALAGMALVLGAVATAALAIGAKPRPHRAADKNARGLALLAFAVGSHAALPGLATWIEPSTWPGMMPPITLVSFLLGTAAIVIAWSPRRSALLAPQNCNAKC